MSWLVNTARLLLDILSSMTFAVMLFIAVLVAALPGALIQQEMSYSYYFHKFGPFWAEVFSVLDLFSYHDSVWFLLILFLLTLSIFACLWRMAPQVLAEVSSTESLNRLCEEKGHSRSYQIDKAPKELFQQLLLSFKLRGYGIASADSESLSLSVYKGRYKRLAYIFIHFAFIIIVLGALLDSNIKTRLAQFGGELEYAEDSREVGEHAILGADNLSYRGDINLARGVTSDHVFIHDRGGVLMQRLPFTLQLKDFRIAYFANGTTRQVGSQIAIIDTDGQVTEYEIKTNQPIRHGDVSIHQKAHADAGSQLKLSVWNLDHNVDTIVKQGITAPTEVIAADDFSLHLRSFHQSNADPFIKHQNDDDFNDFGPSIRYQLQQNGETIELLEYLNPYYENNSAYRIYGLKQGKMRSYEYIKLPLDQKMSLDVVLRFKQLINNEVLVQHYAKALANALFKAGEFESQIIDQELQHEILTLINGFRQGGLEQATAAIVGDLGDKDINGAEFVAKRFVRTTMHYFYLLSRRMSMQGGRLSMVDVSTMPLNNTPEIQLEAEQAIAAISRLKHYGVKILPAGEVLQMNYGSVLAVVKKPGSMIVLLGAVMLVIGILMMFFTRKIFVRLTIQAQGSESLVSSRSYIA